MAGNGVYDVVGAFQQIEETLIASMMRNMKKHIGDEYDEQINWTQWQAEMLRGLQQYKTENADKLDGYYSTINDQIDKTIREAYATGESEQEIEILERLKRGYKPDKTGPGTNAMQGAFFKVNSDKLNALIESTTNDFKRGEKAILRRTEDAYRQIIFSSQMYYNTGAGSLWQAVDKASKDFLSQGINCIQYKNGARVNIVSYSEMALRTANTRANLMGAANMREQYGVNTVKVISRNTACPMCLQWLGRVYYDDVYGAGDTQKEGKYPLLSTAVDGGLFHPNCKDGLGTYYEGVSRPEKPLTDAQKEEAVRRYNLEQQQRKCERNIRKYQRLANGAIDAENAASYNSKLQQWKHEYNTLIRNNGDALRKDSARLRLYGIDKINESTFNTPISKYKNSKPMSIDDINKAGSDALLNAYERRRLKYNLNLVPADELKASEFNNVKANFKGISEKTAQRFADTIEKYSKEYYTGLTDIHIANKRDMVGVTTFASTYPSQPTASFIMELNPLKMADYEKMTERMVELSKRDWCVKFADDKAGDYIATHEFAHTLLNMKAPLKNYVDYDTKDVKKARKEINTLFEAYKKDVTEKHDKFFDAEADFLQSLDLDKGTEAQKLQKEYYDTLISEYSLESADEFMAESFTQSKIGKKKNKYADKVMEVLDKYFKVV